MGKKTVGTAAQNKMLKKILDTSGMNTKMQFKVRQMFKCITRLGGEPSTAKFQVLARKLVKIMGMDVCDKFYGWLVSLEKCLFVELVIVREQHMDKWLNKARKEHTKDKQQIAKHF